MRTGVAVTLAMLAGIGGDAVHAWPSGSDEAACVHDRNGQCQRPGGYAKEYLPPAQASLKAHGGAYVASGAGTVIEGQPPGTRFVILRWDSMEQLKGWRYSPEYVAAHKLGEKYAQFTVVAVNGVSQ